MLIDFEVQRCSRHCAATDRPLEAGHVCYSVLEPFGAEVIRKDYCSDAWNGPPATALGWWKSRVPEPTAKKIKLAPNDVLLSLFDQLSDREEQADMRYVLTLLLIRRRVLRVDIAENSSGVVPSTVPFPFEKMTVYCQKRDASYEVSIAMPTNERIDEIQNQLSHLLIADAA